MCLTNSIGDWFDKFTNEQKDMYNV